MCIGGNDPNDQVKPFTYTLRTMPNFFTFSPELLSSLESAAKEETKETTSKLKIDYDKLNQYKTPELQPVEIGFKDAKYMGGGVAHDWMNWNYELDGTGLDDIITWNTSETYARSWVGDQARVNVDVRGNAGNDTIIFNADAHTPSLLTATMDAWGGEGIDHFVVESFNAHANFLFVHDMEVGETITVLNRGGMVDTSLDSSNTRFSMGGNTYGYSVWMMGVDSASIAQSTNADGHTVFTMI